MIVVAMVRFTTYWKRTGAIPATFVPLMLVVKVRVFNKNLRQLSICVFVGSNIENPKVKTEISFEYCHQNLNLM